MGRNLGAPAPLAPRSSDAHGGASLAPAPTPTPPRPAPAWGVHSAGRSLSAQARRPTVFLGRCAPPLLYERRRREKEEGRLGRWLPTFLLSSLAAASRRGFEATPRFMRPPPHFPPPAPSSGRPGSEPCRPLLEGRGGDSDCPVPPGARSAHELRGTAPPSPLARPFCLGRGPGSWWRLSVQTCTQSSSSARLPVPHSSPPWAAWPLPLP